MSTVDRATDSVEKYGVPSSGGWDGGAFTDAALAPNGTVGAPGYAFSADAASGMMRDATSIRLVWAGATGLRVLATSVDLYVSGSARWGVNSDSNFAPIADGSRDLGDATHRVRTLYLGTSLSLSTAGSASGQTTGELKLIFQASGVSLMYSSGRSSYVVGQSAQSALQA